MNSDEESYFSNIPWKMKEINDKKKFFEEIHILRRLP